MRGGKSQIGVLSVTTLLLQVAMVFALFADLGDSRPVACSALLLLLAILSAYLAICLNRWHEAEGDSAHAKRRKLAVELVMCYLILYCAVYFWAMNNTEHLAGWLGLEQRSEESSTRGRHLGRGGLNPPPEWLGFGIVSDS